LEFVDEPCLYLDNIAREIHEINALATFRKDRLYPLYLSESVHQPQRFACALQHSHFTSDRPPRIACRGDATSYLRIELTDDPRRPAKVISKKRQHIPQTHQPVGILVAEADW